MIFGNMPLRRKLMATMLLISGTVLLLTCAAFSAYEIITLRKGLVDGLTTRAQIIAANSAAALAFQSEADAEGVLGALKTDPRIEMACLYDDNGKVFAQYPAGARTDLFPPGSGESGYRRGHLEVFCPVVRDGRTLGTVYLQSNLSALTDRTRAYAWLTAAVLLGSILVAFLLARALQAQISGPVLALAQTARAVSKNRDFSVRAQKHGEDELGDLTDDFNRMLEALSERTRLLDSVMRNMSEGIAVAGLDGKMLYFNEGLKKITGMEMSSNAPSEWAKEFGVYMEDMKTPFLTEKNPLVLAVQGEETNGVIQFLRNANHPEGIFVSVNGRPIKDEKGNIAGGLVVVRDITEQRKLEDTLRRQSFIASVLENIPNMVFVKDAKDLRFVMFNKAGEDLIGVSRADLIGKNDQDLFPEKEANFFTDKDRKTLSDKKLLDIPEETIQTKKKGTRVLHTKKIPVLGPDGTPQYLMGISEDITDQKQQEKLKIYTQALEASNRDLQDFIFVASHDLQEPLRKIQSFGNFLAEEAGAGLSQTAMDYLDRMRDGASRMSVLLEDLLELTRVTTRGKPFVEVDLKEVLDEVLSDLEMKLKETQGRVEAGELPKLEADPTQMRQLFQNLISNSLKFTKKGEPPLIQIAAEKDPQGNALLRVKDNGIGFDPKYSGKIFNIFQRLHGRDEYEGTGIGLAICRKVVERHGGTIRGDSQLGQGAVFEILLPLKQIRLGGNE